MERIAKLLRRSSLLVDLRYDLILFSEENDHSHGAVVIAIGPYSKAEAPQEKLLAAV